MKKYIIALIIALSFISCDNGIEYIDKPIQTYYSLESWATCFVHFTNATQDSCYFYAVGDVQNTGSKKIERIIPYLKLFRWNDYDSTKVAVYAEGDVGIPKNIMRAYGIGTIKNTIDIGERLSYYVRTDTISYLQFNNGLWYLIGFKTKDSMNQQIKINYTIIKEYIE